MFTLAPRPDRLQETREFYVNTCELLPQGRENEVALFGVRIVVRVNFERIRCSEGHCSRSMTLYFFRKKREDLLLFFIFWGLCFWVDFLQLLYGM